MNKQKLFNDYIDIEKDRLEKYISTSEKDLLDLINFLSEFYNSGLSFYKSVNKKLSSLFDISKSWVNKLSWLSIVKYNVVKIISKISVSTL